MSLRISALAFLALLGALVAPYQHAWAGGPSISSVSDNGPVGRYGKLELTFTLGTTYPNPYDPAAIDIQVVFTGPGGVTRTVNAFWYQAFTRSGNTSGQNLTASGSPVWKARFAPHLTGAWSYQISAHDATGTSVFNSPASVSVLSSQKHGFIHGSPADARYFAYDDGTVYVPLGQNVAWAGSGRTYQYDQWLASLAAQGGNFVRVWMAAWGMCIDWDWGHNVAWLGNYGNHQGDSWELDHVLDTADSYSQAVMLTLIHHGQYSTVVDPLWADNIFNSAWGGPLASPDQIWSNATAQTLLARRWRYLVARYAYSTALHSWELWNEMEWTDNYAASVAPSTAWHQQTRDTIRNLDPYQHLITTSYAHAENWSTSVFNAGMDAVQNHKYDVQDWAQYVSDTTASFLATYPGKPFHLGEFGLADNATSVSQDPTGLSIAETAWASVMSKASSGGAPWFWDGWIPAQNLYGRFKGISTFLAGEDLDQRAYAPTQPVVATASRGDAGISPAFTDWAKSPASAFTLDQNGRLTPDASQMSVFLQGSWQPGLRNPPVFSVNYAAAGQFKVVVSGVSAYGTNTITIKLDGGGTTVNATPVAAGTYSINVPAGSHSILVDSTGQDWFQVSQFTFTNYTSLLRCFALSGTGKVLGWVQSRNNTYWNQCASCQGGSAKPLPIVSDGVVPLTGLSSDGLWNATFFETAGGTAVGSTSATAVGGVLNLPLPAMSSDLAFKLVWAGSGGLQTLTLTKAGTGSGSVASSPAGINCGATCSYSFASGQVVTLSAVATAGSTFSGWSGEGCTGTSTCQVTMSQARSVTATFVSSTLPPSANMLQIDHDVTVNSMVSDRFTWRDAANQPRVVVLAHNDGQTGPGGTRGGELREFRYETPGGTRIVGASSSGGAGFGYVVSHPDGTEACMPAAPDTSAMGHFITGTFTRVFEGRHHVIFRFTQVYPRYCATGAAPGAPIPVPVTLEWVVATGHDNPLWAVTWDVSGTSVGTLMDDTRAPYGELLFDGAATEAGHSVIAGVGWGDRYKFVSTSSPLTLNSSWTWNTPNTVPYVKLWTTAVDATMGTVQTQPITQQDAGGYWGVNRWNTTSASGNACTVAIGGVDHSMPCDFNWPFQSINYSFADANTATNNTRLAWGTNFGFLGQAQYYTHGSAYYGGPLPNTTAPGWPKKSYSTHIVLGTHSGSPVEAQVTQVETLQSLTLSATVGSVVSSGPAGVARTDNVTYTPAGYNPVYGALAFAAFGNQLDANITVGTGSLKKPLLILTNYSGGYPAVKLGGLTLTADVDYFPSLRPGANELWITLNRDLSGPSNHLEILNSTSICPTTPMITSPPRVAPLSTGWHASVPYHSGSSYTWGITNGTITGGTGTNQITFSAGSAGTLTLTVVESMNGVCVTPMATSTVNESALTSSSYYTVAPCRVVDTRYVDSTGNGLGTPSLAGGASRSFAVRGTCGIPSTATAISANVTVTGPTSGGFLTLYPANGAQPIASSINFSPLQTRANNAVLMLATDGTGTAVWNGSPGPVDFLLDVNGYFE